MTLLLGFNVILPANLSARKEKPPEINDFRGFVVAGVGHESEKSPVSLLETIAEIWE